MCGQVRSLALGVELDPPDVSMGSLVEGVRLVLALDQLYAVESWAVEFNSRSTCAVMAQLQRAQRGEEEQEQEGGSGRATVSHTPSFSTPLSYRCFHCLEKHCVF